MTIGKEIKDRLNKTQEKVAKQRNVYQIVIAGAGSGKTTTLVEQFGRCIKEDKKPLKSLVSITFTEKAADELKKRIRKWLIRHNEHKAANDIELAPISTIHSFCARLAREHSLHLGVDPEFTVLDETKANILKKEALHKAIEGFLSEMPISEDKLDFALSYKLKDIKNMGLDIVCLYDDMRSKTGVINPSLPHIDIKEEETGYLALNTYNFIKELFALFCKHYDVLKKSSSYLDFEDLQLYAIKLLEENEAIRKKIRRGIALFQVDEFQDTNTLQCRILDLIRPRSLCLVGDRNQSIYGFRDADVKLFDAVCDDYDKNSERSANKLNINYRSTKEIIDFLNRIFMSDYFFGERFLKLEADPDKKNNTKSKIELIAIENCCPAEKAPKKNKTKKYNIDEIRQTEAEITAEKISKIPKEDLSDTAILLRNLTKVSIYEDTLRRKGIPYYLCSGRYYYAKSEIKDINNYLKVLANPHDNLAFAAVLKSPFVRISDDALCMIAENDKNSGSKFLFQSACDILSKPETANLPKADEQILKLKDFIRVFKEIQRLSLSLPISQLIEEIVSKTGYDLVVLSKTFENKSIFANIRKLIREAVAYEEVHGSDLREFTTYIDEAIEFNTKEGAAVTKGEKDDAIKIMTIHTAKGLEFKNVFVVGFREDFGGSPGGSSRSQFISFDAENSQNAFKGIGLKLISSWNDKGIDLFSHKENKEIAKQKREEEEKRLFYVALSRTKQNLFVLGVADFIKPDKKGRTVLETILELFDFEFEELKLNGKAQRKDILATYNVPLQNNIYQAGRHNEFMNKAAHPFKLFDSKKLIADKYAGDCSLITRVSASSLATFLDCPLKFAIRYIAGVKEYSLLAQKALPRDRTITSTEYGNIAHYLLSTIDWKNFEIPGNDFILKAIQRFRENSDTGNSEIGNTLKKLKRHLEAIAKSNIGTELKSANLAEKEIPFSFTLNGMLFEGFIDVLLDRKTIIDFKTGTFTGNRLRPSLDLQADLYSLALLRSGARQATSKFVFLDNPAKPVTKEYAVNSLPDLEKQFKKISDEIRSLHNYHANDKYDFAVCSDCPIKC